MTKFQWFALMHYLSDFPSDQGFDEIIENIDRGDLDNLTIWEPFENYSTYELISLIEDMVESLTRTFGE